MKLIYSNFANPCDRNWKTFIFDWMKMHWPGVPAIVLIYFLVKWVCDFFDDYGGIESVVGRGTILVVGFPMVFVSFGLCAYILIGVPYNTVCLAIAYKRGKSAKRYF